MMIVLLLIETMLTILFPILALPINVIGSIFNKGKARKYCCFLVAFSLAFIAAIWVPGETSDLYRHYQQVDALRGFNFEQLGTYIKSSLEPIHYLIKFMIAQTGNYSLLQFIVILCGYSELFWLICDYADFKKVKFGSFILIFLYVFSSVQFINFVSGLWFNFAIINIALGAYCSYFKKTKFLHYLFFFIAACLHLGTLYMIAPIIIFMYFKIFRKTRISVIILVLVISASLGGFMLLLRSIFGEDSMVASIITGKYNSYFLNDEQFGNLHTGWNMYLPLANVVLSFSLAVFWPKKYHSLEGYDSFVVYLSITVFASIINAGVFVRYGFLMAILIMPLLFNYYCEIKDKRARLVLTSCLIILSVLQISKSFIQIDASGLPKNVKDNVVSSAFQCIDSGAK